MIWLNNYASVVGKNHPHFLRFQDAQSVRSSPIVPVIAKLQTGKKDLEEVISLCVLPTNELVLI